jgi:hypothetical protein
MADNAILLLRYAGRASLRDRLMAVLAAVRTAMHHTPAATKAPYHPPRRAAFVEDAAMAREMLRL